uniref:Uncharacterized protein n=1 Tax=Rhizophora mucronata TaxID=61149 RepID=A0A2P2NND8_RHIMU
MFIDIDLQ